MDDYSPISSPEKSPPEATLQKSAYAPVENAIASSSANPAFGFDQLSCTGDVTQFFTSSIDDVFTESNSNAQTSSAHLFNAPTPNGSMPNAMEATPPSFQTAHTFASEAHILSPPASNESHVAASAPHGGSVNSAVYPYISAPSSHANMQDSLSIIYPTPPTPMQQFSPQNVIAFMGDHGAWQHQTSSADADYRFKSFGADALLQELSTSPVFDEAKNVLAPISDGFADLFSEAIADDEKSASKLHRKLQQANKEQRDGLRTALKSRRQRHPVRKPPDYQVAMNARKETWSNAGDGLTNPMPISFAANLSASPLEQLGSMIPPDMRSQPPINVNGGFMPSQGGMMTGLGRPFAPQTAQFSMRMGLTPQPMPSPPNMLSSIFPPHDGQSYHQNALQMPQPQNQMAFPQGAVPGNSFPRQPFMFPGSNFEADQYRMGQMNPAMGMGMPLRPGFAQGTPFNNQQPIMFRGSSSGGSVMPLSGPGSLTNINGASPMAAASPSLANNPPVAHLAGQSNQMGSPMPPPPYNSFGSPALASNQFMRPENRAASSSNLISSTTFLPANSSADSSYGSATR